MKPNNEEETVNSSDMTGKSTSQSGAYIICKGATCTCDMGEKTPVELNINSQTKAYINGEQLVATVKDSNFIISVAPFKTCSLSTKVTAGKPCEYQPVDWIWEEKVGDDHPEINGLKILTEKAVIKCVAQGAPGTISFVTHGQIISVGNDAMKTVDDSIAASIICLIDNTVKDVSPNASVKPNVESIIYNTTKSNNGNKKAAKAITVQAGMDIEIKAQLKNNTKNATYIYWYLCPQEDKELLPKFNASGGSVYKQSGHNITLKFYEKGNYFLEGFGQLVYVSGKSKTSVFADCTFLLKVDTNKINKLDLSPKAAAIVSEEELELWEKKEYTFTLKTLFEELTEEHKESLVLKIENAERIVFCPGGTEPEPLIVKEEKSIKFTPPYEGIFYLTASFAGEEKKYRLNVISNRVNKVLAPAVTDRKIRPNNTVEFEAQFKNGTNYRRLKWSINGETQENELENKFTHMFVNKGTYKIKAYIEQFFGLSNKGDEYTLTVKDNCVDYISSSGNKNNSAGGTISFTAGTAFELDKDLDEFIEWTIKTINKEGCIEGKETIKVLDSGKYKKEVGDIITIKDRSTTPQNTLNLQFNQVGEYEISAKIGNTPLCKVEKILINKAKIDTWTFVDKDGNQRKELGWFQAFHVFLKVTGWEGRKVKLNMWHDKGEGEGVKQRLDRIDADEFKQEYLVGRDGTLKVKVGSDSFWNSLKEKKTENTIWKSYRTALLFTISGIDTLCENWKENIYKDLNKNIYPEKTEGTYIYIVTETNYRGLFVDAAEEELKKIIKCGEPAMAKVFINNAKSENLKDYEFRIRLIENLKGKDELAAISPALQASEEGVITMTNIDTSELGKSKDNESKHIPRCFYFKLDSKKKEKASWSNDKFTYPPNYGEKSNNDDNLLLFTKDDNVAIDIGREEAIIEFNTIKKIPVHIQIEGKTQFPKSVFDLEKEEIEREQKAKEKKARQEKTAEGRNEAATKSNSETLKKHHNYLLQLKIAEEPETQNSILERTAKKIGVGLEVSKQHKAGDCFCYRDFTVNEVKSLVKAVNEGKEEIWTGKNGLVDDKSFEGLTDNLNLAFKKYGINSCIQKIAILAETSVETGFFINSEELKGEAASSQSDFKGRGMIQITWKGAYEKYKEQQASGYDIVNNPGLVSRSLFLTIDSGGWYFNYNTCPKWDHPTKKRKKDDGSYETDAELKQRQDASKWKREYFGVAASSQYSLNQIARLMADDEEKYFFLISKLCHGYSPYHTTETPDNLHYPRRKENLKKIKEWFKYDKEVCENVYSNLYKDIAPWLIYAFEEFKNYGKYTAKHQPLRGRIDTYCEVSPGDGWYDAWCAAFVHWNFQQTEYKNTNETGWPAAYDWRDSWPKGESCEPFVGAVIIFNYSHVAFLIGQSEDKKNYIYLGGNQGGNGKGDRTITKGRCSKDATIWLMKPKDYIIKEKDKILPLLSTKDTELVNYETSH